MGERLADAILQAAARRDAEVVVLGSRGLSGMSSVLLGSVSTAVLHESATPVLAVPPAS